MKHKYNKRTNSGMWQPAVIGGLAGLIFQMLCCTTLAYLLEKGSVEEAVIKTAAIIVQGLGIATATVVSWLMENNQKLKAAALASGVVFAVPIITGLLLWGVDCVSVAITTIVSSTVFGAFVWLLHSIGNRGVWRKQKSRYR